MQPVTNVFKLVKRGEGCNPLKVISRAHKPIKQSTTWRNPNLTGEKKKGASFVDIPRKLPTCLLGLL